MWQSLFETGEWQKWFVLCSIPILLALLILNIVPAALAFTVLAAVYVLLDIVSIPQFLGGFTNTALMTLILLLICSMAVERSQLIQYFSRQMIQQDEKRSFIRLISVSALLSAFINNTAVVAAFLGQIMRQKHIAASRLLIPLSYATILGGITTLVGTSTNMVVNSFVVNAGYDPLKMFSFALVGVPIMLVCLGIVYWRRNHLPNHQPSATDETAAYFLTAAVGAESDLIGKTIKSGGIGQLDGLFLLEIIRDGRLISPVSQFEIIMQGDHLIFAGSLENVQLLQKFKHLQLLGGAANEVLKSNLVEVIITNESELLYSTLEKVDFNNRFHAAVVGIRRGNKRLTGRLDRIPLRVGDALLLAIADTFYRQRTNERNFHILNQNDKHSHTLSKGKSILVALSFVLVILASALEILSLFKGLLMLLGLYLLTGCLSLDQMRRRFPFDLLLVIGSALVVSKGLETTGAAAMLGQAVMLLSPDNNAYLSLLIIFVLTVLLTEIITNNAAAALAIPLALQTAAALEVSYLPFVMAVVYGASACFLLPFGYQTHLMIYTPGNYRVKDFLRFGWAILFTYAAAALLLIPLIFPFRPASF